MKGVIWADVFQMFVIVAGLIVVIIIGALEVGGFGNVFKIVQDGGRLDIFE